MAVGLQEALLGGIFGRRRVSRDPVAQVENRSLVGIHKVGESHVVPIRARAIHTASSGLCVVGMPRCPSSAISTYLYAGIGNGLQSNARNGRPKGSRNGPTGSQAGVVWG